MKPLAEQDHYEVLETHPSVDADELERAYRVARAAFADESVGLYSVYSDLEARAVRDRIEVAWQVLSDPASRRAYDASLGTTGAWDEALALDLTIAPERPASSHDPAQEAPLFDPSVDDFSDPEDDDPDQCDGARLRRARLRRGLDLAQIAQVTKVNATHLRCLEDERFEELPAPVYVRGFVAAYARCVGLDPMRVAQGYMARYRELGGDARRGAEHFGALAP